MIQRIQTLYLLGSIIVGVILYFLPLGYINGDPLIEIKACAFSDVANEVVMGTNWLLSSILTITLLVQLISIFMFRNRTRQSLVVQVSLILYLVFVFFTLMLDSFLPEEYLNREGADGIIYNWNIILTAIAWIFTYLAVRAIKNDEKLVRSADRMR